MIRSVLESIAGVEHLPVIALVLFVLVFAGITIWALRMTRSDVDQMGKLPLDESDEENEPELRNRP